MKDHYGNQLDKPRLITERLGSPRKLFAEDKFVYDLELDLDGERVREVITKLTKLQEQYGQKMMLRLHLEDFDQTGTPYVTVRGDRYETPEEVRERVDNWQAANKRRLESLLAEVDTLKNTLDINAS